MKKLNGWFWVGIVILLALIPTSALAIPITTYTIVQNPAIGGPYTYANSGFYLGTVLSNSDGIVVIEQVLAQLGIFVDITAYSKVDSPGNLNNEGTFPMYITYANDGKSGTWTTYPPPPPDPINAMLVDFYVVKGGNDFALYQVNPAAASGTWNVERLRNGNGLKVPSISHFSGYAVNPVPEPGTLLLLGTGLIGLGAIRRRRNRKNS